MKKEFLLLILTITLSNIWAQEYSFPLYFEDNAGNRDTLMFGFDPAATFGLDEDFGEINLIDEPLDSVFNVFFTDAAISIKDSYFEFERTPTYISKKQIITNRALYDWFEMGIVAKHWPVTITWNRYEMQKYVTNQGISKANLFLYSWTPPTSLIGDVHSCGDWPNEYTILNDTSKVVVNYDNFCHYSAPLVSVDSVSPFYIKFALFTGVEQQNNIPVKVLFDQNQKAIILTNFPKKENITVNVFDLNGKCFLQKSITPIDEKQLIIVANTLTQGVYLVQVIIGNRYSFNQTKKMIVL